MLTWPEVIGVAEMMDMNGVLAGSERMVAIADAGRAVGKLVEGHARGLTGPRLQAYLAAGIGSDHEITSGEDLLEKLRAGLAIAIRGAHNYVIPSVVEMLLKLPHLSSQLMFCTDDVPPDQLLEQGGPDRYSAAIHRGRPAGADRTAPGHGECGASSWPAGPGGCVRGASGRPARALRPRAPDAHRCLRLRPPRR